jgi:predicted acetyltransferase
MGFLVFPTTAVRDSYLDGERTMCSEDGADPGWLERAAADFDGFVAGRTAPTRLWDVPVTQLWYVDGPAYIGTVMIRHELTPALARTGGHIGYHVVPPHRRRGHGRRMLADALVFCAHFGLDRVLVTCEKTNLASRKVIEANGGQPDGTVDGELRYWITTPAHHP